MTDNEKADREAIALALCCPGGCLRNDAVGNDCVALTRRELSPNREDQIDAILALRSQRDGKGEANPPAIWLNGKQYLLDSPQPPTAPPPPPAASEREARWFLASQNDGLFIINAMPRPSNDNQHHERTDGPSIVLNVTELPEAKAIKIVGVLNAALPSPSGTEALVKALEEARQSLALADKMLSEHIEQYHDFDYEPPELASLRNIEHHLMGSLILDEEIAALSEHRATAMPASDRS